MTESVRGEEERPLGGKNSRLPRGGRLLGPLFGMVFLIYPVRAVLTSEPTPAQLTLALGGAALFAGVFLWLMWTQEPLRSPSAESSEVWKRRATVATWRTNAVAHNPIAAVGSASHAMPETTPSPNVTAARPAIAT